jgi:hypothetical protein
MTDPAPRRTRSLVDLTVQSSHLLIPLTPASVLIYHVRWAPFQAAQNAKITNKLETLIYSAFGAIPEDPHSAAPTEITLASYAAADILAAR